MYQAPLPAPPILPPDAAQATSAELQTAAWAVLCPLQKTYPGFRTWYWNVMVPGIDEGRRRIIVRRLNGVLAGVAIAKRGRHEDKVCTLWVRPEARALGIGASLLDEAVDWLGNAHPLLTVPEERIGEFLPLCAARRFEPTEALLSYYRHGRTEYVFNGRLSRDLSS